MWVCVGNGKSPLTYTHPRAPNFKVCMLRQPQDLNCRPGHFGSATLLLGAPWGVYGLTLVAQPQHAAQSRPQPKAVPIIVLFSHQARLQPWLRSTAVVLAVHARVSHRTEPSAAPAQRFVISMFDNALQDSMLRDRKMLLVPANSMEWCAVDNLQHLLHSLGRSKGMAGTFEM